MHGRADLIQTSLAGFKLSASTGPFSKEMPTGLFRIKSPVNKKQKSHDNF